MSEAFEKWFNKQLEYSFAFTSDEQLTRMAWQAAKADSAQEIAELNNAIDENNKSNIELSKHLYDLEIANTELQANNNELREALETVNENLKINKFILAEPIQELVEEALAKTPSQSLTKIQNETLELAAEDTKRLNWIESEVVSIDTFEMDESFGWIFTQYYIGEKEPRELYRSYTEDLRQSIDEAIRALKNEG